MHHPTDRMTHTTAFVTPVVEHWLEREIEARMTVSGYITYDARMTNNVRMTVIMPGCLSMAG